MKNFTAKLFLMIMAVTALSVAAVAKTAGSESMIDYLTTASDVESTNSAFREPANNDLINSFLGGGLECYSVKQFKKGRKWVSTVVQVPCPK